MSNLDGIKVNHSALDTAVSDMRFTVGQIDERMQTLESDLDLLKNGWAGNAKAAYQVSKAKWDRAIADMRDILNETQLAVGSSNDDYRDADRRGAALFGG